MVEDFTSRVSHTPEAVCPSCESGVLEPFGRSSRRCSSCREVLDGKVLSTLMDIHDLPNACGKHACECGHPEMRLIPDGIYRCPACGDEVLPATKSDERELFPDESDAFKSGWLDGMEGGGVFPLNQRLAYWQSPEDRLDFYRGHRLGTQERLSEEGLDLDDAAA